MIRLKNANAQNLILSKIADGLMRIAYLWAWCSFKIITSILFPGTIFIQGSLANRPKEFSIYYARHRAHWDIPLIGMAILSTKVVYVARKGIKFLWPFEHLKLLRRWVEPRLIIFIDRDNITRRQAELIIRVVRQKKHKAMVIFPEGTTHPDQRKLNLGFITLAKNYNLPLVPVNIIPGKRYGKDNGSSWQRYLTWQAWDTKIHVGKPLTLNPGSRLWNKALRINADRVKKGEFEAKPSQEDLAKAAMEIVDEA